MISSAMNKLPNNGISGRVGEERRENLEYLADLLGELQRMAERQGYRKLSRMLAISHAEAQRESDRNRT